MSCSRVIELGFVLSSLSTSCMGSVLKNCCLQTCPGFWSSFLPVTEIKHSSQKQLREERAYLAHTCRSQSIIEGSQGRNLRQEPDGWLAILSSVTSNTHSQQELWTEAAC